MANIHIEWLSDETNCDQAGCSGGYSTGARVTKDGELLIELIPHASCFGSSDDWGTHDVFTRILNALGHEVTENHQ